MRKVFHTFSISTLMKASTCFMSLAAYCAMPHLSDLRILPVNCPAQSGAAGASAEAPINVEVCEGNSGGS